MAFFVFHYSLYTEYMTSATVRKLLEIHLIVKVDRVRRDTVAKNMKSLCDTETFATTTPYQVGL